MAVDWLTCQQQVPAKSEYGNLQQSLRSDASWPRLGNWDLPSQSINNACNRCLGPIWRRRTHYQAQSSADVTLSMMLNVDCALIGWRGNMHSGQRGVPWVQQHGSGVCSGNPPGADAANQDSDGRKHGVVACGPATANVLFRLLVEHTFVDFPPKPNASAEESGPRVATRPTCTRGIPRALIRGLHAALVDYDEALEAVSVALGEKERNDNVLDIMVSTMWPYSQQPAPTCRPGATSPRWPSLGLNGTRQLLSRNVRALVSSMFLTPH